MCVCTHECLYTYHTYNVCIHIMCVYIHTYRKYHTHMCVRTHVCLYTYHTYYVCIHTHIQPIADRVAQHLEIISKNFRFSTRRTRILTGLIIYYLVLIVNPMGRILVRWIFFENNLEIQCHPICNRLHLKYHTRRPYILYTHTMQIQHTLYTTRTIYTYTHMCVSK